MSAEDESKTGGLRAAAAATMPMMHAANMPHASVRRATEACARGCGAWRDERSATPRRPIANRPNVFTPSTRRATPTAESVAILIRARIMFRVIVVLGCAQMFHGAELPHGTCTCIKYYSDRHTRQWTVLNGSLWKFIFDSPDSHSKHLSLRCHGKWWRGSRRD